MIDRLLQNNTAVKILAVFLAVILWVYITGDTRNVSSFDSTRTFVRMPVSCYQLSEFLEVVEMLNEVDVTVRGRPEALAALTPDDLELFVDLRGLRKGEHVLPIKGRVSSEVKIDKIFPAKITVVIDEVITRQIEVKPVINGEPAAGLITSDVIIEPLHVVVKGTSGKLSQVEEVWVIIDVEGAEEGIKKTVPAAAVNSEGQEVTGLELMPEEVEVYVHIRYPEKEIPVQVIMSGELPEGFEIMEIQVQTETVILTGLQGLLDEVEVIKTLPVDLSERQETFSTEVEFEVPEGTSLKNGAKVIITVVIEPVEE